MELNLTKKPADAVTPDGPNVFANGTIPAVPLITNI
jgi:hypothetical protein